MASGGGDVPRRTGTRRSRRITRPCGRSRTSLACPSGRATSPPPRRRHKGSSARTKRPAKKTRCRNADTSVVRHPVATRCARRQRRRKHSHGAAARLAERPPRERRRSTPARLRRGSPKYSRRRSVRTTRVVFFVTCGASSGTASASDRRGCDPPPSETPTASEKPIEPDKAQYHWRVMDLYHR